MFEHFSSVATAEAGVRSARPGIWTRIRSSPFWIVVIAFSIRIAAILILHTYRFRSTDQNFGFGWEMGRIGESIASGHGFSNPFGGVTGPTAWEPPLYPYLIAGVFKIFKIYSHASSFVLLAINSCFSALTCIPVFLIGRRCFGERVGVASAWTWALLPYIIYWCTRWVWETSLSALLLATIFWLALTMEDQDGLKPWMQFGLFWGVAALNSPVLLSFLPVSGLWAWYRQRRSGKSSLGGVVLASVIFFGCIVPWLIRNYLTFGTPVFIRSNFGAELRMGNGPWANGTWMYYLHPTQNKMARQEYEKLGEIAYVAERKRQAMEFVKENPGRFLLISLKRFVYYWAGSMRSNNWWLAQVKNSLFLVSSVLCFWGLTRALSQRKPGAWLFLLLLLVHPVVYYVVFTHARYRHPIEPEIGILAIFLISETARQSAVRESFFPERHLAKPPDFLRCLIKKFTRCRVTRVALAKS
jgi:4-amino-4-deoxy-L-arabinose transferase-like glycosyltransferase